MKSRARAVVIGGGVIGCSMIYQLTRQGWTDVVLIEKGELTSGSTWHAAGQVPFYSETPFFARLGKASFDTYEEVERETGTPVGLHKCGSLRIARTAEEMLEYKRYMANTRDLGIDCELVGPGEAKELFPLLASNDFAGALYVHHDGWTDPSQTTNAIAGAARAAGAVIERHTRVEGIARTPGGEWRVETDKGDITAEVVINCAGLWGAEVSAMMGGRLPVLAIEHEYLVTDTVPELAGRDRELPILRDLSIPTYIRQERDGLLVACYESDTVFWGQGGIPRDFGQELLPPDLDRAAPKLEATAALVPAIGQVGVKTVVNGPTGRSPDLQALVGPAHGQRGLLRPVRPRGWVPAIEPHPAPGGMDHRGRARHRPLAGRRAPLRCLCEQPVRGRAGRRRPRLFLLGVPSPFGARGWSARAHEPALRPARGAGCGLRRAPGLGGGKLVRAGGHGNGRPAELPPGQLVRGRGRRVPGRAEARGRPRSR